MKLLFGKIVLSLILVLVALAALFVTGNPISAHERRDVGNCQFTVGWIVEPSFEGMKNGLDLRVISKEGGKPVEGLEKTLKWELTHVPSGVSKIFDVRTIFRDPGHYTADIIPTVPGVYRFRLFGTVEGADVNQTFVSKGGGGGFGDIEPSEALQFPEKLPSLREVNERVSRPNTVGLIGVALGAIGIAFGMVSLGVGRRKR